MLRVLHHMKNYKITDEATGDVWLWTAQQLLEEVNRDRSSEWTAFTLQDLETCPYDVLEWVEYTIDEVPA
jgi:hypothetical protein